MTLAAFSYGEPVQGLLGGLLIGLAGALMLLGGGRIAGVSGITARATGIAISDMPRPSAWAFLIGLPAGAFIVALAGGWEAPHFASWPVLTLAGLLVGLGTQMGSGCTSGHGVCGVSRLSQRSLVATATFVAAGVATVAALNAAGGH